MSDFVYLADSAFLQDGSLVATVGEIEAGVGDAQGVRVSPDGKVVVVGSDEEILFYHVKTGHLITKITASAVQ